MDCLQTSAERLQSCAEALQFHAKRTGLEQPTQELSLPKREWSHPTASGRQISKKFKVFLIFVLRTQKGENRKKSKSKTGILQY